MNKYALGIDLGGTGTKFGLVNKDGKVLRANSISTQQYPDINEYCDALCAGLNRIVEEENLIPIWKGKIPVSVSILKDSDAAILGAASLVW